MRLDVKIGGCEMKQKWKIKAFQHRKMRYTLRLYQLHVPESPLAGTSPTEWRHSKDLIRPQKSRVPSESSRITPPKSLTPPNSWRSVGARQTYFWRQFPPYILHLHRRVRETRDEDERRRRTRDAIRIHPSPTIPHTLHHPSPPPRHPRHHELRR